MVSGPASFSTPNRINGPIFSRAKGANSRTIGSCDSFMVLSQALLFESRLNKELGSAAVPTANRCGQECPRSRISNQILNHRLALVDFLAGLLNNLLQITPVTFAGGQRQTTQRSLSSAIQARAQVAQVMFHFRPSFLVARKAADSCGRPRRLLHDLPA